VSVTALEKRLTVIGSGLAGTLLVRALTSRGAGPITWLGRVDTASGSSVPCALVHPFVGRSFAPSPDLAEAWRVSSRWAEDLPSSCAVHRAPMQRVAGDDRGGDRLRRSWERHHEQLSAEMRAAFTLPPPPDGGRPRMFTYGPTFALDLPAAIRWCQAQLTVAATDAEVARLEALQLGWRVHLEGGDAFTTREVVVCAGAGARGLLRAHTDTGHLEHVEGRLVHQEGEPLRTFTIDRGHVASSATRVAWGSSFRSCDRPGADDAEAQLHAIESRLAAHCPTLPRLGDASVWSGVRVVDKQSRRPWIETVGQGLHVFSAFGSKGVLWIPLLAERWAERWAAQDAATKPP